MPTIPKFNDKGLCSILNNCKVYRGYMYARCKHTKNWYLVKKIGSNLVYYHGYQNSYVSEISVLAVINRIVNA